MIRTVLTEAAQGDVAGQAAVAAVIRNRLAAGGYGDTPTAVVRAPNQFEVWSNGRAQAVDPRSAAYQAAGEVVDAIANGDTDPTGGATHFFSPSGQQALGRNAPAWGRSKPLASIGGQLFYAPQGTVDTNPAPDPAPQSKAPAMAAANLDEFKQWGLDPSTLTAAKPAATGSAPAAAPSDPMSEFAQWGVDPKTLAAQGTTPAAQPPGKAVQEAAKAPAVTADPKEADASMAAEQGLINGVPIAGPALLYAMNHGAAAIRALREDVPYSQAVDEMNALSKAAMGNHPTAATAGGIAGATISTIPLVAAAPAAFGVSAGRGIIGNSLMGAASGSAIGAADALARGENPIFGAGAGAFGGGAGPIAGRAVGALADAAVSNGGQAVNALANYLRTGSGSGVPGIGRSAANLFNQVVDDPAIVQQFLAQHGPLAMPADADPSLMSLAGGLASKPGAAQATVRNALTERANGAGDRISNQVEATVGPEQSPQAVTDAYAALRNEVGQRYQEVYANAPPVDVRNVVDLIDRQLENATGSQRTALQNMRRELVAFPEMRHPSTGELIEPEVLQDGAQRLHNLRQDLDAVINYGAPGLGVEKGAVARSQGSLQTVRRALDDALKTQVPGMAEVDARSSLLARNQAAVETGNDSVMGANVPHPDDFAAMRAGNNPATNAAMNAGMAGRIYRAFGTGTQRDAVTLNKLLAGGEDGYSAQNLATAFGQEPTSALLDTLARERAFNDTAQTVLRNSETARRTAANKLLDATEPGSLNLSGATLAGVGLQSAKALANPIIKAIMESPDAPRNFELARILTAQGASAQEIVAALARLNSRNQTMTGIGAGARAALAGGVNRLMLGAGVTNR